MIKKFQRILSGVLAAMFVGQVMIYGDGSSQGIAMRKLFLRSKNLFNFPKMRMRFSRNMKTP